TRCSQPAPTTCCWYGPPLRGSTPTTWHHPATAVWRRSPSSAPSNASSSKSGHTTNTPPAISPSSVTRHSEGPQNRLRAGLGPRVGIRSDVGTAPDRPSLHAADPDRLLAPPHNLGTVAT